MKLCARMRVTASHVDEAGVLVVDKADLLDVSVAGDDHPDGTDLAGILHVPGLLGTPGVT